MKATKTIISLAAGAILLSTLMVEGVDAQGPGGKGNGRGLRLRDGSCITGTTSPKNVPGQGAGQTGGYGNGSGIRPQNGTGFGPGNGAVPCPQNGTGFGGRVQGGR
jgi:hypothetical protein